MTIDEQVAVATSEQRRERIALEYVRALLAGPHAYLWDDPEKLADKAIRHAEALIARLEADS